MVHQEEINESLQACAKIISSKAPIGYFLYDEAP